MTLFCFDLCEGNSVNQSESLKSPKALLQSSSSAAPAPAPAEQSMTPLLPMNRPPPVTPMQQKEIERRYLQLRGAFRVMLTLEPGQWTTIHISGRDVQFLHDESALVGVSSMPRTHHFIARDRESHKLYWFEQFAAIATPQHVYVEFCALSNGDVCIGVWETRCNRPFHALLIYHVIKKKVELYTAHNFRHIYAGVVFDTAGVFDLELMQR